MYFINFTLLLIEHIRSLMAAKHHGDMFLGTAKSKSELIRKAKSTSPCHMWKICNHWSQMTFLFEIVISIGFWSFVADAPDEPTAARKVCLYMDHSVPFTLLLIDFILNRVYYELHSLWINLIVLFIYGMINLSYTKITGKFVYPVVHWDSVYADIVAFAIIPLFMLLWLALFYISEWKFKKLQMETPDANSQFFLTAGNTDEEKPNFDDDKSDPMIFDRNGE